MPTIKGFTLVNGELSEDTKRQMLEQGGETPSITSLDKMFGVGHKVEKLVKKD